MPKWLGSCSAIRSVTCITLVDTGSIVNPRTAQEGCGGMTCMAIQPGIKVGRVDLGTHADRCITIMAGGATIYYSRMIKHCTDESTGVMTDTTILTGWNMSDRFIYGETSTMT